MPDPTNPLERLSIKDMMSNAIPEWPWPDRDGSVSSERNHTEAQRLEERFAPEKVARLTERVVGIGSYEALYTEAKRLEAEIGDLVLLGSLVEAKLKDAEARLEKADALADAVEVLLNSGQTPQGFIGPLFDALAAHRDSTTQPTAQPLGEAPKPEAALAALREEGES